MARNEAVTGMSLCFSRFALRIIIAYLRRSKRIPAHFLQYTRITSFECCIFRLFLITNTRNMQRRSFDSIEYVNLIILTQIYNHIKVRGRNQQNGNTKKVAIKYRLNQGLKFIEITILLILNLRTRWWWVVNITPRPLYLQEKQRW
jgi:hypothetical protein